LVDLDLFKANNDRHGHDVGDRVIFAAGVALGSGSALAARVGGEEFAVLLPDALLSDGRLYAETVRGRFAAQRLPVLGVDRCFTASLGVAQAGRGDTLHDLLHRADAALYSAKAGGRNLVRVALGELPPLPAIGRRPFPPRVHPRDRADQRVLE
ncbi:MAG: diguanylate cyclase, partial [Sphingomonas sp.]